MRASTTKNRKEALLPLHPQLLGELQALRTPDMKASDPVFARHPHLDERIRIDLTAASIARIDEMGRKLDFHALRYTFATKLASSGVSQRLAQELLRHSDPRLTANIYTDVTQLPTFAAVNALPWQKNTPQVAPEAAPAENQPAKNNTAIDPQTLDTDGQTSSLSVTASKPSKPAISADHQGFKHVLSRFAKGRQSGKIQKLGAGAGFEPATFRL